MIGINEVRAITERRRPRPGLFVRAAALIALGLTIFIASAGPAAGSSHYRLAGEWGELGSGDGQFLRPVGIDVDQAGDVYVADVLTGRIQRFDAGGARVAVWGGTGVGDGKFDELVDVDVDLAGNVYALDVKGNTVQRFDGVGGFVSSWQARQQYYPDVGVSLPVGGISTDSEGNVFVSLSAHTEQGIVRIFDGAGGTSRPSITGASGAILHVPTGIAIARDGVVYVADTFNRRIQTFRADGSAAIQIFGSATPDQVFRMLARGDVELDSQGNLYVADFANARVHIFNVNGELQDSFEIRDTLGRLALPGGIAVDNDGNVYVTAYYLGKVLKFAPAASS